MVKKKIRRTPRHTTKLSIKTTVLDLLEELTAQTKDDTLVMAVVKNIFATHKVRLARTLAPVRLVSRAVP